jgi:hypothetical protein
MEGKGVLFKRFAGVDVFDIELNTKDPDEIVRIVKALEPTFGGINLEDIKAPECFYIEEALKKICDIPIFHDDQHGTAIISGAALINALELVNKKVDQVRVVFAGAGAAGIACADLYLNLGVKRENILFVDTVGVIYQGRTEKMNPYKQRYAVDTKARTISDALKGVQERGPGDDGGPVLVVVEYRDLHPRAQLLLDVEALRCLDVLQVDAAEGGLERGDDVDQLVGVGLVHLDVKDVDAGELLEEHRLAFHHRLARERADVAQPEHGGAVGDDGDEVAARGEIARLCRIGGDLEADGGDTWRIGERKVALIAERLGSPDLKLPWPRQAMIDQRARAQVVGQIG